MKSSALLVSPSLQKSRLRCRKKFLYYFPKGFTDQKYIDWERNYKWEAHLTWIEQLNRKEYEQLLADRKYSEIAFRGSSCRDENKSAFFF